MERQEILNEVCNYVKYATGIKTDKDIAGRLKISQTSLSCALNGSKRYLSDRFMLKFKLICPELNIAYLLYGEGDIVDNFKKSTEPKPEPEPSNKYLEIISSQQKLLYEQQLTIAKLVEKITQNNILKNQNQ